MPTCKPSIFVVHRFLSDYDFYVVDLLLKFTIKIATTKDSSHSETAQDYSTYLAAAAQDIVHSHMPAEVDHIHLADKDSRLALDTPSLTESQ